MAIAVELSIRGKGATIENYFKVIQLMGAVPEGAHPDPGCLFHWVRSDPSGVFVTDVWKTREEFDKFAQEQIGPKSEQVGLPKPQHPNTFEVANFLTAGS
jgi:hypothetical protein